MQDLSNNLKIFYKKKNLVIRFQNLFSKFENLVSKEIFINKKIFYKKLSSMLK